MKFRNLCIIAHVDHGKTTLVDFLLRQAGSFRAHESVGERVMDSMDLERERGITILAKNTAIRLGDTKINIVDTPGHADFGGEVERILSMVDGCLLLVDAAEGPLPQTRFVLQKALARGFRPIVVVNKVDRPECRDGKRVTEVVNAIFDLFVDLGASDEQAHFPMVYACARQGWCVSTWDEAQKLIQNPQGGTLKGLFDLILKEIPEPQIANSSDFKMLISNLSYSDYVGELAIGRVFSGRVKQSDRLFRFGVDAKGENVKDSFSVTRLYTFEGLEQKEVSELEAGDIGILSGSEKFEIGDTIGASETAEAFARISVEKPTVGMLFCVSTSPFVGQDGKPLLSRTLYDRLSREAKKNVAIRLENTDSPDQFRVLGRGELQFAILIEQMRRENLEFMVGKPTVLLRGEGEMREEPLERLTIDVPSDMSSEVTSLFQGRRGILQSYEPMESLGRVRLVFEIPTRGLLGMRSRFLTITRGEGLMSSELVGYTLIKTQIFQRSTGALISDRRGVVTEYALKGLEDRGVFFCQPGTEVYEGMIVGESNKDTDLNLNVVREKKLTNFRAGPGTALEHLHGVKNMSLEDCLEWMEGDEWLEVTPKNLRLRKKILACNMRGVKKVDMAEAEAG
jgi:GTP-binding protein